MARSSRVAALVALAVAVLVLPLRASDPLGVYCLIQKVVLEPADCPDHAQISGACAVANPRNGSFETPAKGYFYYSIPAGKEEVVRREWNELKTAAGTMEPVGFGSRYQPVGRLRPATEKPDKPDVYPVNIGVAKLGKLWPAPPQLLQQLKDLLNGK
jgi:hypothetical protein